MEELRQCGRCRELKPLEDFAWHQRERGTRQHSCRACHSEYHREHYLANKQRYIAQAAASKKKLRWQRTSLLLEYLEAHPCADCGESDPVVLEFDHLEDKSFGVAQNFDGRPWQRTLEEIEKCEVVCANCHRRREAARRQSLRYLLTRRPGESDIRPTQS
jgi:hypothetical protein